MSARIRVVIADDERPARAFLANILRLFEDVEIVGEAASGTEAVALIEKMRPDLALLDLQMPELDGIEVVRSIHPSRLPLIAFVTAFDEYAVKAFDANAIDYLLKPVEPGRVRKTLTRAHDRLERADLRRDEGERIRAAATVIREATGGPEYLRRIPVRHREDILLLPVDQVVSIEADGELLHIVTLAGDHYTVTHRLKDIETRLDPAHFVRLSRSALANLDMIKRVSPMPGGTYVVTLANKQQLAVSRLRARVLREHLFKL